MLYLYRVNEFRVIIKNYEAKDSIVNILATIVGKHHDA
jgi:hypothetical protein